jgi:hypothetical protein
MTCIVDLLECEINYYYYYYYYYYRLEELTQELLSAKKIIQLLQEDAKVDKVTNATQTVS